MKNILDFILLMLYGKNSIIKSFLLIRKENKLDTVLKPKLEKIHTLINNQMFEEAENMTKELIKEYGNLPVLVKTKVIIESIKNV